MKVTGETTLEEQADKIAEREHVKRVNKLLKKSFGWFARGDLGWEPDKDPRDGPGISGSLDIIGKYYSIFVTCLGKFQNSDGSELEICKGSLANAKEYANLYHAEFDREVTIHVAR